MSQTPDPQDGVQPEFLEQGGGRPLARESSGRRRRVLVPVLAGLGLAAVGGAAFGAWWFLDDGAQAAEAFPASSVGYVGLTLDPSGSQKLEALRTLEKFPWVAEELGLDGDLGDVDLRETLAQALLEEADCEGLSYTDDLESWLGDRIGLAAVALGDEPQPLFALEVRDGDAAMEGMAAVTECAGEGDSTAYAVDGDWMLVAETEENLQRARELVEDEGTLADDEDFQRWTGELDAGLVTLYAAPGAGALVVDHWDEVMGFDPGLGAPSEPPAEVVEAAEEFEGGIAQVRFDDGGLELELAGSMGESELLTALDGDAGALTEALPEDTALVYAYGLGEGWTDWFAGLIESDPTAGLEPGDVERALQETVGLGLEDIEEATGDALALAVGSDVDADALFRGDLGSVPVALVMDGDAQAVQALADALVPFLGPFQAPGADLLGVSAGEDVVAVGPDAGWRDEVAEGGGLGDSERFRDVVPDNDGLVSVTYVDIDVVSDVVISFMEALEEAFSAGFSELPGTGSPQDGGEMDEIRENLEPLAALGSSSWIEADGSLRGLLRISTD
ncbi:MAG: DUF3352 domain-containing protein [Actinobacteria bacterium]|nr:DUF3352 domain-containing protein [Actinomycetota bacterium]